MKKTIYGLVAALAWLPADAEVTAAANNGFTTVNEVVVVATRAEAWNAALAIGRWWSSDHTISGDAARMSIDPVTQGCFCESLGEVAGVVHLVVTTVMPETSLRMTGGLGPLGLMGVNGNMTWDFDEAEDGATRIRFTYAVGGYMDGGLEQMAGPVDYVLGEALARLKTYIETGNPESEPVD
jgi:uncharacterized protein YndB with AHSA1/START domain